MAMTAAAAALSQPIWPIGAENTKKFVIYMRAFRRGKLVVAVVAEEKTKT